MAEEKKKKRRTSSRRSRGFFKDVVEWVEETFADPEIRAGDPRGPRPEHRQPARPRRPSTPPCSRRSTTSSPRRTIDEMRSPQTIVEIKALADTILTFADVGEGRRGRRVGRASGWSSRSGSPTRCGCATPAPTPCACSVGLILEDDEILPSSTRRPVTRAAQGRGGPTTTPTRWSTGSPPASGGLVVLLDRMVAPVGGTIDAMYGWDPEPGSDADASVVASRALSVVFDVRATRSTRCSRSSPSRRATAAPGC